MYLDCEQI